MRHHLRWLLLCSLLVPAALVGCSHRAANPDSTGSHLYVNPNNPLLAVARTWNRAGHHAEAQALQALAAIPSAVWAAGQTGDISMVRSYSAAATRAQRIGLVVAYNLPYRDSCGKFSANDKTASNSYKAWVRRLAGAIGTSHDIVIVEPDGLPDILLGCLSKSQTTARYELLHYAMQTLSQLPHAQVYLDAGNPGMTTPGTTVTFLRALAPALVRAGIYMGEGFSANVSNFQQTDTTVAWSQLLEQYLGHNMRAVIDTSRNGHGPYVSATKLSGPVWCNPPGRALGTHPTLNTGQAGVVAYLWIKDPGVSDGACNHGPSAGQLWPQYALGLTEGNSP